MQLTSRTVRSPDAPGAGKGPSNKLPLILVGVVAVLAAFIAYNRRDGGNTGTGTTAADTGVASTGPVEISMWDSEESENQVVLDAFLNKFQEANPNIRVSRQTYPTEDLRTKFVTAATAGQASDIVWGPNDIAGVFSTAGLIQPVDGFVDMNKFVPAVRDAIRDLFLSYGTERHRRLAGLLRATPT